MNETLITFLNVLAWFGLAGSVLVIFRVAYAHYYLETSAGHLDQALAGLRGQTLKPGKVGNWWLVLVVSIAWLIASP